VIRRTIALTLLVLILTPAAATADKTKARALFDRATKQYNLGEYAAAGEGFKAAYDEFPDPTLLYNLAQCERQLAHKSRAVTLYRSYLREVPEAANANEVRRLIASLEEDMLRDEQARKQAEAAKAKSAPPPLASTVGTTPVEPAPMPRPRLWWRNPAGWALVGAGVVIGAAGGALLGVAQIDQNDAPHAPTLSDARADLDQASTFRTVGFVLVGVGAASAIAGVAVLALMPSRWKTHAALVPSSHGAMLTLGGAL